MHVCLFDIDGTLLSSGGAGKAAMDLALSDAFGAPPDCSRDVKFSGRTDRAIARDLFAVAGVPFDAENWDRFVMAYLRRLPECLERITGKVLPGIQQLLQGLQTRDDVALGLLTGNTRRGASLKLGHYGLFEYFAFGGFGDEHWERNDVAREALQFARDMVGGRLHLDRVWVIGDTPLDIQCARSIGAKAVAVATGWDKADELAACEPDLLVEDFSDPSGFLNCL